VVYPAQLEQQDTLDQLAKPDHQVPLDKRALVELLDKQDQRGILVKVGLPGQLEEVAQQVPQAKQVQPAKQAHQVILVSPVILVRVVFPG
jgi:hypothetical protein